MPRINDIYDQEKIDRLKHFLEAMAAKGQPRPYEIFVDTFKVVPKTDDPKEFDGYEYYMNDDTKQVRVNVYCTGQSPRNDSHIFKMPAVPQEKHIGQLDGLERMELMVKEKLDAREKEYESKRAAEQLEECREKLEQAESYIEQLEQQLETATSNKHKINNLDLVELGASLFGRWINKNAHALHGLGIAGVEPPALPEIKDEQVEGNASFQRKNNNNEPTEKQLQYIAIIQQLESRFNEEQMVTVIGILNQLMTDPTQLQPVGELLNLTGK
jgi:hypothetical protein